MTVNPGRENGRYVETLKYFERMKNKFLVLIMLFAYLIGTVNGIGYSIYIHEYVTAICVAVLSVMAFPMARNCWKELNS